MKIFYSPSLGGFFSPEVHDPMPADAVHRVTPKRHRQLIAGQEQGARIVPGKSGSPMLEWPDRSASARRLELVRMVKREARRRIVAAAPLWRQINDLRAPSAGGKRRFARVDAIRAASARIEADVADCPAALLDEFPVRDHLEWPRSAEGRALKQPSTSAEGAS